MAKTYSAIQTYTLGSAQAQVVFSNIPQNYTDLKVVVSSRCDGETVVDGFNMLFNYPAAGGSGYTNKNVGGTGTVVSYGTNLYQFIGIQPGTAAVSGSFGNSEIYIPNYTSSIAKTYYGDSVTETNSGTSNAAVCSLWASNWSGTSAITSITFGTYTGNFIAGSTFTLYGIGSGAKATGGTVVGSGNYIYHTFLSTGSFIPTEQIKNAEVIVLSGGGGGGSTNTNQEGAGGGGAGGLFYLPGQSFNAGTTYVATVGSGGAAGVKGVSSTLGPIVASVGGGLGGDNHGTLGGSGGSGGGNGGYNYSTVASSTAGQGTDGGTSSVPAISQHGGGGGGAGAPGSGGSAGGAGGIGSSTYSSWHYATQTGVSVGGTYYIAGGGGGGAPYLSTIYPGGTTGGAGGSGGGGAGGNGTNGSGNPGTAGTANTGGGGGGAGNYTATGGTGGSGLVIIRYPIN